LKNPAYSMFACWDQLGMLVPGLLVPSMGSRSDTSSVLLENSRTMLVNQL